jgi:hypothetical protein
MSQRMVDSSLFFSAFVYTRMVSDEGWAVTRSVKKGRQKPPGGRGTYRI